MLVDIHFDSLFSDVIGADEAGDTGFADDFLNMMGGVSIFL